MVARAGVRSQEEWLPEPGSEARRSLSQSRVGIQESKELTEQELAAVQQTGHEC
ncbi:unnamed protein product, partial [Staurois parvus]